MADINRAKLCRPWKNKCAELLKIVPFGDRLTGSRLTLTNKFDMYYTRLPDPNEPGFDEQRHFSQFKKHNVVFNAWSSESHCDDHIGCLSLKTVLSGEEWYTIDRRRLAVRPGQFLILNDDQRYACRVQKEEPTRVLSIFFKREFASAVFRDCIRSEEASTDNPSYPGNDTLEFFQTLHPIEPRLLRQLWDLTAHLDSLGDYTGMTDEHLLFLLRQLVRTYKSEVNGVGRIDAVKASTRKEIFRRVCFARDLLHSAYREKLDLDAISKAACLSVPQLVRQFQYAFRRTPHSYLAGVRLHHAADLLRRTDLPVTDVSWQCGFDNPSAFGRAFKAEYGIQPAQYRAQRTFTPSGPSRYLI
jgi:AraC-like DNA-binding protein